MGGDWLEHIIKQIWVAIGSILGYWDVSGTYDLEKKIGRWVFKIYDFLLFLFF